MEWPIFPALLSAAAGAAAELQVLEPEAMKTRLIAMRTLAPVTVTSSGSRSAAARKH